MGCDIGENFGDGGWARLAPIAQVTDKARIVRGEAPEFGPRHLCACEELFDLA